MLRRIPAAVFLGIVVVLVLPTAWADETSPVWLNDKGELDNAAASMMCRECCLLACDDFSCFCMGCIPVPVDKPCPHGYIPREDCPDGGGGSEGTEPWPYDVLLFAREEADFPEGAHPGQYPRLEDICDVTEGLAADYGAQAAKLYELFPPDMPLDDELAAALIRELYVDFEHQGLNELWQCGLLYKVWLAAHHPDISDAALDALQSGLLDYWQTVPGEHSRTLDVNFKHALKAVLGDNSADVEDLDLDVLEPDGHIECPCCFELCTCHFYPPDTYVCWCEWICWDGCDCPELQPGAPTMIEQRP
ncbi:MAG: hypothetical protein JXQ75_02665 [Phycisphaerae bacterium]|nr:hypothetical protein [Phycisphaerae bacterium]